MNKYKYMFIDAQILLTTGQYAVMHEVKDGRIKRESLLRMFILSVFKLVREVGVDRPFLVWDSSPYHKSKILKELIHQEDYKGDRGYKTADDITDLNAQISKTEERIAQLKAEDPILNEAEINELEDSINKYKAEIERIDVQIHNFRVRSEVKYFIIKELQKFGFTSIIKRGYEADDIITMLSDWCNTNKYRAVIVSKDSDYDFMLNPYVDKYNQLCRTKPTPENPNPKWTTYDQVIKYWWWIPRDFPDKKLYEVKGIMDSAWGSHNFLHKTVKAEWSKPGVFLIDALNHGEDAFDNWELFQAQLATFDFSRYPDYDFIKVCLPWYSKQGCLLPMENFRKFLTENKIRVNPIDRKSVV